MNIEHRVKNKNNMIYVFLDYNFFINIKIIQIMKTIKIFQFLYDLTYKIIIHKQDIKIFQISNWFTIYLRVPFINKYL